MGGGCFTETLAQLDFTKMRTRSRISSISSFYPKIRKVQKIVQMCTPKFYDEIYSQANNSFTVIFPICMLYLGEKAMSAMYKIHNTLDINTHTNTKTYGIWPRSTLKTLQIFWRIFHFSLGLSTISALCKEPLSDIARNLENFLFTCLEFKFCRSLTERLRYFN